MPYTSAWAEATNACTCNFRVSALFGPRSRIEFDEGRYSEPLAFVSMYRQYFAAWNKSQWVNGIGDVLRGD